MKIKENLEISTQDFWYDLTDGYYLEPYDICENTDDADRVYEAIKIIEDFHNSCEEQIEGFIQ